MKPSFPICNFVRLGRERVLLRHFRLLTKTVKTYISLIYFDLVTLDHFDLTWGDHGCRKLLRRKSDMIRAVLLALFLVPCNCFALTCLAIVLTSRQKLSFHLYTLMLSVTLQIK